MHEFSEWILEITLLLILWFNETLGESNAQNFPLSNSNDITTTESLITWSELKTTENALDEKSKNRADQSRSYYNGVPVSAYMPAFDPISVLASLAFLAFLLQSFAALFDRTRSIMPTIISSRRTSSTDYNEQFADLEKTVLRSLEEYASISNDMFDDEKDSEKPSS